MPLLAELAHAARFWVRRPAVALAAVASLAAGLAVATSVFSLADAALWRPLPLPSPDRVVWIDSVDRGVPAATSPGVFTTWSARATQFETLGALRPAQAILRDGGASQRIDGVYASAGALRVLGLPPAAGRAFEAFDDTPGAPPVLMISHRLWRQQFAADTDVLGRSVTLGGQTRTIIGVVHPAVEDLAFGYDWWAPLALTAAQAANSGPRYLAVIGRARTGGGDARELARLPVEAGAAGDTGEPLGVRITPLKSHLGSRARPVVLPLLAAVLAVVLLGALNAASLLLAQGQLRRGEIAVRASLGASRAALVRQLLFESAWLVATAGALSLVLSLWLIEGIGALLASDITIPGRLALDGRAVLFTGALAAAVTTIAGLVPALRNSFTDLRGSLARGRSIVAAPDRLRRALVVLQVALALTIGSAGALMGRTTYELGAAPGGYDRQHVLTGALQLPAGDYPTRVALRAAVARVTDAVRSAPGVAAAAMTTRVPLSGGAPGADVALVSEPFTAGSDRQVRVRFVTPEYFRTVGTPILAGRDVTVFDTEAAELVVLVNETLARRLAGNQPAVERRVKFAVKDFDLRGRATPWRIVGVVADTRDGGPRVEAQPEIYLPMAQGPAGVLDWIGRQVLVAARPDAGRTLGAAELRAAIAAAEPGLALYDVRTLDERFRDHLATERTVTAVLVPLGVTGFLLAAFGIFTLLMQLVAGRRQELAIRMALGATSRRVVQTLVREGLTLAAAGAAFGCLGAVLAAQALTPFLFGVSKADPATLVILIAATAVSVLAAVWVPATKAVRVDPAAVLRSE
jgi:putative ABC transport system permease protein